MAAPATPAGGGEPPTLSNTSHPPLRPSFAAVTKGQPETFHKAVQLAPRQYGTKDGKPTVHFTQSELQPGILKLQHSLIAKFSAGRPRIDDVRRQLTQAWDLDTSVTIGAMDARHVLIILPNAPMANRILAHPTRKIGNYLFRIFRWAQDFNRNKEPTTTTSWIKLPGLPSELFDAGYLEAIVKPIGHFLAIDEGTRTCRNPSFARACVELDLQNSVPSKIWIVLGASGGFWQAIEFENKLLYCKSCKLHGHLISNCRKRDGLANDSDDQGPSKVSDHDITLGGRQLNMPVETVTLVEKCLSAESGRSGKEKLNVNPSAEAQSAVVHARVSSSKATTGPKESSCTDSRHAVGGDQEWTTVQSKKKKKKGQEGKNQVQKDTAPMLSLSHVSSIISSHTMVPCEVDVEGIDTKERDKCANGNGPPLNVEALAFVPSSNINGLGLVNNTTPSVPSIEGQSNTSNDVSPTSDEDKKHKGHSNVPNNASPGKMELPLKGHAMVVLSPISVEVPIVHNNASVQKGDLNSLIPNCTLTMEDRHSLKTMGNRKDVVQYSRRANPYID